MSHLKWKKKRKLNQNDKYSWINRARRVEKNLELTKMKFSFDHPLRKLLPPFFFQWATLITANRAWFHGDSMQKNRGGKSWVSFQGHVAGAPRLSWLSEISKTKTGRRLWSSPFQSQTLISLHICVTRPNFEGNDSPTSKRTSLQTRSPILAIVYRWFVGFLYLQHYSNLYHRGTCSNNFFLFFF